MIRTVPTQPGVTCTAWSEDFQHLCPIVQETDHGQLTVQWVTTAVTLELHALAAYLRTWADTAITHEDLCQQIATDLADAGIADPVVTYTGTTAGLTIHASAGPRAVPREPLRG